MRSEDVRAELLAFDRVTVGYGAEPILAELSFNVRRGEVAGLVALDGRGKSTLVRCAAGLLEPTAGKVLYDQRDIYATSFEGDQLLRARTAVVFEGGALFANRSIFANIALPLRYHNGGGDEDVQDTVRRLLERCGYNESLTAFPWQVSARGRKLAAFARALAREPELIIVDRFFEALEVHDQKRLMELVLELNVKNGTSFLLVSELDQHIFHVAERVAVLEGGRLRAHGFKQQLLKDDKIKHAFAEGETQEAEKEKT
jgi:phospholipid/cholesterol/gamma-HCH transport system ATP-binding protein